MAETCGIIFSLLSWSDKFTTAIEITKGLMCLHAEQIIHRYLVKNFFDYKQQFYL